MQNAHSLYLENLDELGVVGFALLIGFLAVPAVAAARVRRSMVFPGAVAAFAAYLVHAGADWDWELTGVTIVAVLAAVSLIASARSTTESTARTRRDVVMLPLAFAATALALVSVLGAVPLGRSRRRSMPPAEPRQRAQRTMPRDGRRGRRSRYGCSARPNSARVMLLRHEPASVREFGRTGTAGCCGSTLLSPRTARHGGRRSSGFES